MHEKKIYRVIDVQDNPYHDNEPMAITSPDEEFVACLKSQGTVVFLDTRQNTIGIHIKFSLHKLNVVCRRKWKVKNVSTISMCVSGEVSGEPGDYKEYKEYQE